ncbi:hypothetical protein [Thermohalobacter berrensis]|uniref:Adhesin domain-containing protein n=1 Tax=Thermohalobacter berrensis TaxID=99594 RepID=A0A419SWG5_9FIRM|nr:hypothetical protein [Thermohalobacter berrensis]RKD29541.1 hypothetical protein BET03_05645 [Thermohalobacter berrensis]
MKKYIVYSIFIFLLNFLVVGCIDEYKSSIKAPFVKEDTYSRKIEIDKAKKLKIESIISDIDIKQTNTDELIFKIDKKIGGNNEEKVNEFLSKFDYKVSEKNGIITIISNDKGLFDKEGKIIDDDITSINSHCIIEVPKKINEIDILNRIGQIGIMGKFNKVNIENRIGDVKLEGDYGTVNIKLDIGDISINGDVDKHKLNNNVGEIKVNGIKINKE